MADMNFAVNLLPTTDKGANLGSSEKHWNLSINSQDDISGDDFKPILFSNVTSGPSTINASSRCGLLNNRLILQKPGSSSTIYTVRYTIDHIQNYSGTSTSPYTSYDTFFINPFGGSISLGQVSYASGSNKIYMYKAPVLCENISYGNSLSNAPANPVVGQLFFVKTT